MGQQRLGASLSIGNGASKGEVREGGEGRGRRRALALLTLLLTSDCFTITDNNFLSLDVGDVASDPAHLYSFVHQLKRLMVVLPPPPSSVTCSSFDVAPFRSVEHLIVSVCVWCVCGVCVCVWCVCVWCVSMCVVWCMSVCVCGV